MKPRPRTRNSDRRSLKLNRPPEHEAWVWFTQEMLESPAFRAMNRSSFLILNRICLEHMAHAGSDNGRLPVTQRQFAAYGVRKQSVPAAIAELEALGFAVRTDPGCKYFGEFEGRAARFRLTWLPVTTPDNIDYATNDWRRFPDLQSAKDAIRRVKKSREDKRATRKSRKSMSTACLS